MLSRNAAAPQGSSATASAPPQQVRGPLQGPGKGMINTSTKFDLFSGVFNKKVSPSDQPTAVGGGSSSSADPAVLSYLDRALRQFEEETDDIETFHFDEDRVWQEKVEKMAGPGRIVPSQPVLNDPFHFEETSEEYGGREGNAQSQQRPLMRTPTKPATRPTASDADSRMASGAMVSAAPGRLNSSPNPNGRSTFRYATSLNPDGLYALPTSLLSETAKNSLHGPRLATGANRASLSTPTNKQPSTPQALLQQSIAGSRGPQNTNLALPAPPPSAANQEVVPPPSSRPGSSMRLVKYRPPAVAVVVDDGYIRFCPQCSKVVTGRTATTCPHCESSLPPPSSVADESEGTDSSSALNGGVYGKAVKPRGPLVHSENQGGTSTELGSSSGGSRGAAPSPPQTLVIMSEEEKSKLSIEELEKVERLEFQAAVAAWRQDRRDDAAAGGSADNKTDGSKLHPRRSTLFPVPYYFHLLKEVQKFVEQQQHHQQ